MRQPSTPQPPTCRPRVLIVDSSEDNREVLRTVLARRGMSVLEAAGGESGLKLAQQHQPDVVVLDAEALGPDSTTTREQFAAASGSGDGHLIVLGKIRRGPRFAGGHVVSKPYHFAPLIHTIERLAGKAA